MAPLSIGTDTGGSIRQPAGLCGVTGMKPTYGRVSRYGLVAFASSLDQIGPLARTAEDAALLLEVLAGHDPRDSTSVDSPVPRLQPRRSRSRLTGLRLGLVREHFGAGLDAEVEAAVREAVEVYRSLGAKVKEVSLPHGKYGVATYYIIAPCEASSNLARYDGVHYGYRTDEKKMRRWRPSASALRGGRRQAEARGARQSAGANVSPQPGRGFRGRGEAPHHARHLRPERRLLRRLLPQGAEGPPADPPGFRPGVRAKSI